MKRHIFKGSKRDPHLLAHLGRHVFCTESLANVSLVTGHGRAEYTWLDVIVADPSGFVGRSHVGRPAPHDRARDAKGVTRP